MKKLYPSTIFLSRIREDRKSMSFIAELRFHNNDLPLTTQNEHLVCPFQSASLRSLTFPTAHFQTNVSRNVSKILILLEYSQHAKIKKNL